MKHTEPAIYATIPNTIHLRETGPKQSYASQSERAVLEHTEQAIYLLFYPTSKSGVACLRQSLHTLNTVPN